MLFSSSHCTSAVFEHSVTAHMVWNNYSKSSCIQFLYIWTLPIYIFFSQLSILKPLQKVKNYEKIIVFCKRKGFSSAGATDIPVVAMETRGAHCLRAALDAGKPVSIGEITR